ncbi:MAG: hypothetical protein AB1644_00720 [Candidatus Zixiibacteriota bacterium]
MTSDKSSFVQIDNRAMYAYLTTLALFFVASFYPELRLWGIGHWAFLPAWGRLVLLVVGLLIPFLIRHTLTFRSVGIEMTDKDISAKTYLVFAFATVVVLGSLFYLLRARYYFLGDGYTLLSELSAETPLVKGRGIGEGLTHVWLKSLIGGDTRRAALLSYQLLSIGSGLLFMSLTFLSASALFDRHKDRLIFAVGILSGGYMLLFFGYVENYASFCLSICLFTLAGLLIAIGKLRRWLILLPLVLALFFHVLGLTLIPAAAYILFRETKMHRILADRNWLLRAGAALVLITGAALLFTYLYRTEYYFRFAFVPIWSSLFTVEGYTLFSAAHLLDFGNLILTLMPGLLVALVAFNRSDLRQRATRPPFRFLLLLAVPTLVAAFVLDPKPGMPRDWDLFSFPGVPIMALSAIGLLASQRRCRYRYRTATLVIALGGLSLIPRAIVIADFDTAVTQVRTYYALDKAKSAPIRSVLSDQLALEGRLSEALREAALMQQDYPEAELMSKTDTLLLRDSCETGIALSEEVIRLNPLRSGAWASIGYCLNRMGQRDSALLMLRIADGLNPYNPKILVQLARVYFNLGDTTKSEQLLLEAHHLDPKMLPPIQGLTAVYRSRGDTGAFRVFFTMLQAAAATPKEYFVTIGDDMARNREFKDAAVCYQEALRRGLDSAVTRQRISQYPELQKYL